MRPIEYVARLNEFYLSQGFPPYRWTTNETAPLAKLGKPLNRCRVAMLTSGGVSRKDAPGFNPQARNDLRLDVIGHDTSAHFFAINDDYYSHADADRDINCIFLIDRLRELAAAGEIGEVAPHQYSGFMTDLHSQRGGERSGAGIGAQVARRKCRCLCAGSRLTAGSPDRRSGREGSRGGGSPNDAGFDRTRPLCTSQTAADRVCELSDG